MSDPVNNPRVSSFPVYKKRAKSNRPVFGPFPSYPRVGWASAHLFATPNHHRVKVTVRCFCLLVTAAALLAMADCHPLYADELKGNGPDETMATSQLCKDSASSEDVVCAPYFSLQGQLLAKQWKISAPPIDGLPMSEVDPPRDVSAEKWQSRFCTDWDDGCTSCIRNDLQAAPSCTKFNSVYNYHGCTTHRVYCNKADSNVLNRMCSVVSTEEIVVDANGRQYHVSDRLGTAWIYWGILRGGWQELADEPPLPDKRNKPPPPPEILAADIRCDKTFQNESVIIFRVP